MGDHTALRPLTLSAATHQHAWMERAAAIAQRTAGAAEPHMGTGSPARAIY